MLRFCQLFRLTNRSNTNLQLANQSRFEFDCVNSSCNKYKLEGARESAYLRQVNFYRIVIYQHFVTSWVNNKMKNFKGSCPDCLWEHANILSNSKSVALTVLGLLLTSPLRTDTHLDTHRTKTVSPPFTPFTWRR